MASSPCPCNLLLTNRTQTALNIQSCTPKIALALITTTLNRGVGFTHEQRRKLGLIGRLPSGVLTLDQQAERVWRQLQACQRIWPAMCLSISCTNGLATEHRLAKRTISVRLQANGLRLRGQGVSEQETGEAADLAAPQRMSASSSPRACAIPGCARWWPIHSWSATSTG